MNIRFFPEIYMVLNNNSSVSSKLTYNLWPNLSFLC